MLTSGCRCSCNNSRKLSSYSPFQHTYVNKLSRRKHGFRGRCVRCGGCSRCAPLSGFTTGKKTSIDFFCFCFFAPFSGNLRGKGFRCVNKDGERMRSLQSSSKRSLLVCLTIIFHIQTLFNILMTALLWHCYYANISSPPLKACIFNIIGILAYGNPKHNNTSMVKSLKLKN